MARTSGAAPTDREATGPRSLTRLLGLFDALAKSSGGLTLAELNTVLDSPKSSLLNLLRPLVADGYLGHAGGRYMLGPAIFRLAANIVAVWNFSSVLRPFLEELGQRTAETVYVGVLDRVEKTIIYVDSIECAHSVRYSVPVGAVRPLYATAAGRVLLAFADDEFQTDYLSSTKLEPQTAKTISSRKALREELERIRERRISVSVGEMFPDSAGMSAPIFGAQGAVIAAMAVGGPAARMQAKLTTLRPILADVAARASGLTTRTGRLAGPELSGSLLRTASPAR